ncbi:MAG TPA: hypothetical protein DCM60_05405 [Nitrospina sp.]|nr:hypothetical protein [Nitrospina sp.]
MLRLRRSITFCNDSLGISQEQPMTRILILLASLFLLGPVYGETLTNSSGDKYVGDVANGIPHGQGTTTWANGAKYVGEYRNGRRHGQGTYTFADGAKYVGEWQAGKPWNAIAYDAAGELSHGYTDGVPQCRKG